MATRGRKPVPTEVKRRRGNPGKRALPDHTELAAVPAIDAEGWELPLPEVLDRVLTSGVSWLASTDHPQVALLVEALRLHDRATASGSIKDVVDVQKHVASLLSELGFTPASRARLGLAEVRAMSKLEELRGRKTSGGDKGGSG